MCSLVRSLALVVVLLFAGAVCADSIDPDRPDLSESARPVAPGVVQLESGIASQRTSQAGTAAERRLSVETALRVGVLDWLELRLDGEPFVRLRGDERDTGHGDVAIGAKIRLWQPPGGSLWPTIGILPFVKPPVADAPIGTDRPDFGVTVLASFGLPAELSLDFNARAAAIGQTAPTGYLAQAATSASLGRKVGRSTTIFTEWFFHTRETRAAGDQAGLHAGIVHTLTPDIALDGSVLTSLIGRAPDYALRAGVSVRFGR